VQEVQGVYEKFTDLFFESCDENKGRIKWGLPANDWEDPEQTVSEGIGYGMMLAAYFTGY